MGSLVRAISGLALTAFVLASAAAVAPALAAGAYYPATADPTKGPLWEQPKITRFAATRCGAGAKATVDQIVLNRDDVRQQAGFATYTDASRDLGYEHGAGGWSLKGPDLTLSGDGFQLRGRWIGPFLTATITWTDSRQPVRCRFQVNTLRSFTQYQ
jgi:hypothetical protein